MKFPKLEPGEGICYKCEGKGYVEIKSPEYTTTICLKCMASGKIDWVTYICNPVIKGN